MGDYLLARLQNKRTGAYVTTLTISDWATVADWAAFAAFLAFCAVGFVQVLRDKW